MNFIALHKDDIYDSVANIVAEHDLRNKICFEFLYRFLQSVIESNNTVIPDFGFNNVHDATRLKNWIAGRNGELKVIHCICSDDSIWSERLSKRSHNPLPNQLITDLSKLKAHYKDIKNEFLDDELVIDTILDNESNVQRILSFLNVTH